MLPVMSGFKSRFITSFQYPVIAAALLLLTACLPEEKDDTNPINSLGDEVDDTSLALNGFWNGGLDQTETLRMLIYNGDVYGIDADKAFFGTLASPTVEEVDFDLSAFPLSYEDSANNEFVADGNMTAYIINGLLATSTTIVGDFETDAGEYGSLTLTNDGSFANNSSLANLAGKWTTTDLELNITSLGNFHGVNNGVDQNCSFEGKIKLINASDALMTITLNRRRCDDFNGDSNGFAAINEEGELEIYSKMGSSLLFMTFNAPAATTTSTETEEPTAEETSL